MAAMKKYKVSRVDAKSDVSCSLGDFCTGVQAATGRPQNVILDIIQQQQALLDVAWLQVFAHLLHTDILCPFLGLWAQFSVPSVVASIGCKHATATTARNGIVTRIGSGECVRLKNFVVNAEITGNTIIDCGVHDYVFGSDPGDKNGEGIYIGTSINLVSGLGKIYSTGRSRPRKVLGGSHFWSRWCYAP